MPHERPVLDGINLVVRDMEAATEFYGRLGLGIADAAQPWDRHHREVEMPAGLDFDLDSDEFAKVWDRGWPGLPTSGGAVLGFKLASRDGVDSLYAEMTGAGYTGQQAPYDAFWGARYAVIQDPDGNAVGLMSPSDPARQTAPPDF